MIVNKRVALLIVAAVMISRPMSVFAQSFCDSIVIDSDHVLGDNLSQIEESAGALQRAGADIHVVLLSDKKAGDLAAVENTRRSGCPTWQGNSRTGRSSSLLLVLVSVPDRRTAIYYGPQWVSKLDPFYQQIARESMNPRFETGDFTGGLQVGLERITSALIPPTQPAAASQIQTTTSVDMTGFANVLLIMVGGGGALYIIVLVVVERSGRLSARRKARDAANAAIDAITGSLSQRLDQIDWDVKELTSHLSEQDVQRVSEAHSTVHRVYGQASGRIAKAGNVKSSILWMGRTGFTQMERSYRSVQEEATAAIMEAEEIVARHQQVIAQAPQEMEAAQQAIAQAAKAITNRRTEYCTTTLEDNLALARRIAKQAGELLTSHEYETAITGARQAKREAEQVTLFAQNLPQIAKRLPQMQKDAAASYARANEYLQSYRKEGDFRSLFQQLAPAQRLLEDVISRLTERQPDYVLVQMELQEAQQIYDAVLAQAHAQMRAYERLRDQLHQLTRQTTAAIASVRTQIERTRYSGRKGREKLAIAEGFLEQSQDRKRPLAERHGLVSKAYSETVEAAKTVGRIRTTSTTTGGGDSSGFVFVAYSDGGSSFSGGSTSGGGSSCGGGGGSSGCGGGGGGCGGGGCGGGGS